MLAGTIHLLYFEASSRITSLGATLNHPAISATIRIGWSDWNCTSDLSVRSGTLDLSELQINIV